MWQPCQIFRFDNYAFFEKSYTVPLTRFSFVFLHDDNRDEGNQKKSENEQY